MVPQDRLLAQIDKLRELSAAPFIVNFVMTLFSQDTFDAVLERKPPVISLALGLPSGELISVCTTPARNSFSKYTP
jgi:hypothetical protein